MVNLRSLIAAVEAGVAMAAPTYVAGDVSITVENGMVVASATAGGTSYSISTTQRSVCFSATYNIIVQNMRKTSSRPSTPHIKPVPCNTTTTSYVVLRLILYVGGIWQPFALTR